MSTIYIDPVGGLAGDMLVAALIDAGAPLQVVFDAVAALGIDGVGLATERVWRGPFSATRFVVTLPTPTGSATVVPAAGGHDHAHGHGHEHPPALPDGGETGTSIDVGLPPTAASWRLRSRRWADIDALLAAAPLPARVSSRARETFRRLAVAEGAVHGISPDQVTFHEVGSLDALVDIVGASALLEWHGVEHVVVGVLPLGTGHVLAEHGWIPLPAPATVELLRGMPIEGREVRGETVTPTGAALAAALARPGSIPAMRLCASGVGAGTWDPASHPNVVRVFIGVENAGAVSDVVEIQTEVDTLPGELVPPLIEALLAVGAVDAYVTPVLMKKGRPGWLVTAVAPLACRAGVVEVLLRDGHTLGVRWSRRERVVLDREHVDVTTVFGTVRIKIGRSAGVVLHAEPEFEDCRRVAAAAQKSVVEVHAAALAAWAARSGIT